MCHSIECRINAENPITSLPSTGMVTTYHPPGGPGIRVDSLLYSGCSVTAFYDGLVSKIIVKGNTRNECIMRLNRALDEYVIEGGLDKRSSLDSIQQAVFASTLTGKKPAVAIYDTNGTWGKYEHRIYSSAKKLGIKFFWVSGNKIKEFN